MCSILAIGRLCEAATNNRPVNFEGVPEEWHAAISQKNFPEGVSNARMAQALCEEVVMQVDDLRRLNSDFVHWYFSLVRQADFPDELRIPIEEIPQAFAEWEFYHVGWFMLSRKPSSDGFKFSSCEKYLLYEADTEPPWKTRGGIDPSLN